MFGIKTAIRNHYHSVQERSRIARQLEEFSKMQDSRFSISRKENLFISIDHVYNQTPPKEYLIHAGWAARELVKTKPSLHIDVSSITYFSTIISAFIPTRYIEYRPDNISLPNLQMEHGDLLALEFPSESVESISCMHVIEHLGLGRYGDPIDPTADLKAMHELERVCRPSGHLFLVLPVGRPRIEFNAHRIYSYNHVITAFKKMKLVSSALVMDGGRSLISEPEPSLIDKQNCGCGCFVFKKH